MKKVLAITSAAIFTCGLFFTSCNGVSSKADLKTETDSISYAFGAKLYDNEGLNKHLEQLGLVTDTLNLNMYYKDMIAGAPDAAKKAELEKEYKTKSDSINKANIANIADFLKGMKEGLDAPKSKEAYMAGLTVGSQISKQMFPYFIEQVYGNDTTKVKTEKINAKAFLAGLATAMQKGEYAVPTPNDFINNKVQAIQAAAAAKQAAEMKIMYKDKIASEATFLETNKAAAGVVTLPDGVQYKIVKAGTGAKPAATDMVKVNYHGTLVDGTVFDSSVERKAPATFNVSGVIKGWTEILQLMPVGSKWTVYIPYDLAYGAEERGAIKPFSTLIFDVELLSIETAAAQPQTQPQANIKLK